MKALSPALAKSKTPTRPDLMSIPQDASTIDLFAIYAQPSVHRTGQRRSLKNIDSVLSRYDLQAVLHAAAMLSYRLESPNEDTQQTLAEELDPTLARQYHQARARQSEGRLFLVSPQGLQRLAVRALVACSERPSEVDGRALAAKVLGLTVSLQDHMEPHDGEELALEISRLAAYYQAPGFIESAEVSAQMISCHHRYDRAAPEWVDLQELLNSASALTLESQLAIGILAGLTSVRSQGDHRWPPTIGGDFSVPPGALVDWANLWARPLEAAQERAALDLESGDWAVGSLVSHPLIDLSSGRFIWVRPTDVQRASSPVMQRAIFERLAGTQRSQIGSYWGYLTERVGHNLVIESVGAEATVLDEEDLRRRIGRSRSVCDGVVSQERSVMVYDFTTSGLTVRSLTDAHAAEFWRDHEIVLKAKVSQLDSTINGLALPDQFGLVAPLVVTSGVMPWTPFVADRIQKITQAVPTVAIERNPSVLPVRILSMVDFRRLLAAGEQMEIELAEVIEAWIGSSYNASSLETFLMVSGVKAPENLEAQRLVRSLGGGAGEVPLTPSPWDD